MKKKELIQQLQNLDNDGEIIIVINGDFLGFNSIALEDIYDGGGDSITLWADSTPKENNPNMKTIEELFKPFPNMVDIINKLSPMTVNTEYSYSGGGCEHYLIHLSNGHLFQYHPMNGDFVYSADSWDSIEQYFKSGLDEYDNEGKIGGFGWEFIDEAEGLSKGFSIQCEEEDMTPEQLRKLDELVKQTVKHVLYGTTIINQ